MKKICLEYLFRPVFDLIYLEPSVVQAPAQILVVVVQARSPLTDPRRHDCMGPRVTSSDRGKMVVVIESERDLENIPYRENMEKSIVYAEETREGASNQNLGGLDR